MFGAGQCQVFAQHFEQGLVWREGDFDFFAVEGQAHMRLLLLLSRHNPVTCLSLAACFGAPRISGSERKDYLMNG